MRAITEHSSSRKNVPRGEVVEILALLARVQSQCGAATRGVN